LTDTDARTALDYFGHYLVFAFVGAVSTTVALLDAGIAFGLPGLMYFLLGPALTVYWRWRTKSRVPAVVVAERAAL
jgi:hypothetical protein